MDGKKQPKTAGEILAKIERDAIESGEATPEYFENLRRMLKRGGFRHIGHDGVRKKPERE